MASVMDSVYLALSPIHQNFLQLVSAGGKYHSPVFSLANLSTSGLISLPWEGNLSGSPTALIDIEVKPGNDEKSKTVVVKGTPVTKLIDKSDWACTATIAVTDGKIASIIYTPITSDSASALNTETQAEIARAASGDCGIVLYDDCGNILDGDCDALILQELLDEPSKGVDSYDIFVEEVLEDEGKNDPLFGVTIFDEDLKDADTSESADDSGDGSSDSGTDSSDGGSDSSGGDSGGGSDSSGGGD